MCKQFIYYEKIVYTSCQLSKFDGFDTRNQPITNFNCIKVVRIEFNNRLNRLNRRKDNSEL